MSLENPPLEIKALAYSLRSFSICSMESGLKEVYLSCLPCYLVVKSNFCTAGISPFFSDTSSGTVPQGQLTFYYRSCPGAG